MVHSWALVHFGWLTPGTFGFRERRLHGNKEVEEPGGRQDGPFEESGCRERCRWQPRGRKRDGDPDEQQQHDRGAVICLSFWSSHGRRAQRHVGFGCRLRTRIT